MFAEPKAFATGVMMTPRFAPVPVSWKLEELLATTLGFDERNDSFHSLAGVSFGASPTWIGMTGLFCPGAMVISKNVLGIKMVGAVLTSPMFTSNWTGALLTPPRSVPPLSVTVMMMVAVPNT